MKDLKNVFAQFVPSPRGAQRIDNATRKKTLTAADLDFLFASLSARTPSTASGDDKPLQTTVIVHGDAIFIKLLRSHETTVDIDYLTANTNPLLEGEGLEDPIELVSEETVAVGRRRGRGIRV